MKKAAGRPPFLRTARSVYWLSFTGLSRPSHHRPAFDRMNVDLPQAAHPQHIHLQLAIDPVAIERTDQIIDAIDRDIIETNDDVARQQPGLRRRPSGSICISSAPILFSTPASTACRRGIGALCPDTPI